MFRFQALLQYSHYPKGEKLSVQESVLYAAKSTPSCLCKQRRQIGPDHLTQQQPICLEFHRVPSSS